MQLQFVIVECDVYCKYRKEAPRYRAYINDELFTERTWIWNDAYLQEQFQIQAPPGRYQIRYEPLDGSEIDVKNWKVKQGPGAINQQGSLEVRNENT